MDGAGAAASQNLKSHLTNWIQNPYLQISVIAYSVFLIVCLVCWYFYCFWQQRRKEREERRREVSAECAAELLHHPSTLNGGEEVWCSPPPYEEVVQHTSTPRPTEIMQHSGDTWHGDWKADNELPTYDMVAHIKDTQL